MQYTYTLSSGAVFTSTYENGTLTESMAGPDGDSDSVSLTDDHDILMHITNFAARMLAALLTDRLSEHNVKGVIGTLEFHEKIAESIIPIEDAIENNKRMEADLFVIDTSKNVTKVVPTKKSREEGYQA